MSETAKERLLAVVRLAVPTIVSILALWGISVDADMLVQVCTVGISFIAWIWSWWKNNNVTTHAIAAQQVKEAMTNEGTSLDA